MLPSLWAALMAVLLAWGLHWAGGFAALAAAAVLLLAVGIWAVGDDAGRRSEVVVDKVLGMWVALLPLSAGLALAGTERHVFPWPGWLGALVLLLAFERWPAPVAWAERRGGAAGVMLRGLTAGALAAMLLTLGAAVAHGWLV